MSLEHGKLYEITCEFIKFVTKVGDDFQTKILKEGGVILVLASKKLTSSSDSFLNTRTQYKCLLGNKIIWLILPNEKHEKSFKKI